MYVQYKTFADISLHGLCICICLYFCLYLYKLENNSTHIQIQQIVPKKSQDVRRTTEQIAPQKNQTTRRTTVPYQPSHAHISDHRQECMPMTKTKTILLWHSNDQLYNSFFLNDELAKVSCPECACRYTKDRSVANSADVIVFNLIHIRVDNSKPHMRCPHQVWAGYMREGPISARRSVNHEVIQTYMFNWTITYRRNSDVIAPYGRFIKNTEKLNEASIQADNQNVLSTKNHPVAFLVTNCLPWSGRILLAKDLQKEIVVHIYGECGNYTCPKGFGDVTGPNCWNMIEKKYYFYLAFENSLCIDYLSERLYETLNFTIIPVVFADINSSFHEMFPPKSFIDVRDFVSVKALAIHLNYLIDNPDKYMEYFNWRRDYKLETSREDIHVGCEVCKKLSSFTNHQNVDIKEQIFMHSCVTGYTKNMTFIPLDRDYKSITF